MNIRTKLAIQFVSIVAVIFILASMAIYYFSARYREDDFYKRLHSKSLISTKMLIEVEEVTAEVLAKIEINNPTNLPEERLKIFNYKNELLYSSDKENKLKETTALLDEIRLNEEVRFREGTAEVLGYHYKDKYDRFVVIISAVDVYGLKKLTNLKWVLTIVFAISIVLIFISGFIYASRALRPINKVIDQVDDISIRSLDLRVNEGNGHDEIARLARKFNDMLGRLEKSFKMQENFIANASHELRTPLTAISGQLEVVLFRDRDVENYKSTIASVLEEIKNLILISNRLLLLAQANSEKTTKDFRILRVDEVIGQSISDIQKRNPEYNIDLEISDEINDEAKLTIYGNEPLLRIAFVNLLDNGCKFSEDHLVMVRIDNEAGKIRIEFIDKGYGIPEEDQPHILEPFHRAKNILKIKGHGIGLSIVDMIVKIHSGTLSFVSEVNSGSTFTLYFPSKHKK